MKPDSICPQSKPGNTRKNILVDACKKPLLCIGDMCAAKALDGLLITSLLQDYYYCSVNSLRSSHIIT